MFEKHYVNPFVHLSFRTQNQYFFPWKIALIFLLQRRFYIIWKKWVVVHIIYVVTKVLPPKETILMFLAIFLLKEAYKI